MALAGELDVEADLDAVALDPQRERLERALRSELVERRGPEVGDERAEVADLLLEPLDRVADGGLERAGAARPSGRAEQHLQAGEALKRLVVQLARPAAALVLGGHQALPVLFRGDRRRRGDGGGGAHGESLEQPLVLRREDRAALERVEREQHAVRLVAEDERHDEPALAADAEPADPVLLETRAVELLLEPLRPARAQRRARDRVLERDPGADQAVGKLARSGRDLQLRPAHELDQDGARRDERAAALGDELEDHAEVGAAADRLRDLRRRVERRDRALELVLALPGAGVAAGVVDGDAGELGEQHDRVLVLPA